MSRHDRRARTWPLRVLAAAVAAMLLFVLPAAPAGADEEESTHASELVEQAIALIANDGGNERVAERIDDALTAPDKEGVDLAKVSQAREIIEAPGEDPAATAQARALLLDSLGGKLPSAPEDGLQATGTETGTSVILDEFNPARGISDGGDAILLGLSLAVLLGGLYLARRLRPPHSLRQLTHSAGKQAGSQKEA
ncbi:hypothetical protein [Amycolatopsis tucumanensis]|uniref:Uncharacterized protein n=1 Tax=Amycolatopsis tucumanensis TaxID=401106 RepID=A0ABP7JXG2_9PSEU|nr:hypothetical protein [Amycolatopsis tucumanensis]MCF6428507.1 hypothetical protein [Amycolatopsis tucumanensis]